MNQENAYSKGYKEKYLLKSKTIVDLVGSIVKILYMCVFDKINHHHPQKEKKTINVGGSTSLNI